jgi:hypothetical protein rflaF_05699
MIKGEYLRNSLLESFPSLGAKKQQEIEDEYMVRYILYRQIKRGVFECYCTHCRRFYVNDTVNGRYFITDIAHNKTGVCLECNSDVTYLAMGKGRKSIRHKRNFAVFKAKGENLYIRCFTVYERFSADGLRGSFEDSDPLDFEWYEPQRYCITPGGAQHWGISFNFDTHENRWHKTWQELKSENDPNFNAGEMCPDNSYTVIDRDEVEKTFLRYAENCIDQSIYPVIDDHYIKYLCEFASHPNIEYLIKSGFGYIISRKLNGDRTGIRINYRSNDVKKMLKLNKTEMSLLKNSDCETLSAYYALRKIDPAMDVNTRFQSACRHRYHMDILCEIINKTGLSLKKILNYADKHGGYYGIKDWNDYLDQCIKLEYDMTDTLITKPKNLHEAHERLTKIIKLKADELAQQELEERNKKLAEMEYIDEERGLQIVIPKSVQEIIDEGKRLDHCVGGYADRHAKSKLTILFLRTTDKPDVPYYTMEVSTEGRIVQCRGYKNNMANNPKPQEIIDFEKDYQIYLDALFGKKSGKRRIKISA